MIQKLNHHEEAFLKYLLEDDRCLIDTHYTSDIDKMNELRISILTKIVGSPPIFLINKRTE